MMSTPIYPNPSEPPFPFEEHNQAQQDHEHLFNREHHQDEAEKYVLCDESSDGRILSSTHSTDQQSDGNSSLLQQEHDEVMKEENYVSSGHIHHGLSIKWMSSKMRLMKKMSNTDHTVLGKQSQMAFSSLDNNDNISSNNSFSSNNNNFIRTCSDCNTTKTPLWRSGPRGPKSLCNACGIRQRKARRAMAAAQAEPSDTLVTSETSSTNGNKLCIKAKRCKLTIRRSQKKHCFEDLALSLRKSSAYHQVFPQDEKEAAILLMALSCGRSSSWLNGFL